MTITILGFSSSLVLACEALAGDLGALYLDSKDLPDLADLADLADLFDYVGSTANDTLFLDFTSGASLPSDYIGPFLLVMTTEESFIGYLISELAKFIFPGRTTH